MPAAEANDGYAALELADALFYIPLVNPTA
jgi:hypothetical protein